MKRSLLILAMATSLCIIAPAANASIIQYSADLKGSNEQPANLSPGTGSAVITIDDVLNKMIVDVTFSGLVGTTTAAHIHCCTAAPLTGVVGVATPTPSFASFPTGVSAGSYYNTLDLTQLTSYNPSFVTVHGGTAAGAEAFLLSGMSLGEAYFNIHTNQFPGGEIRGFLTRVQTPEPASLALLSVALMGLACCRRNKA